MGLFSKKVDTTPARAFVAPQSTGPAQGNINQLSANGRVKCKIALEPVTASGRGEVQVLQVPMPNWLHVVLYHVGSNYNIGPSLPAELDIPVLVETGTDRIAAIDVDATAAELERYHEMGRQEWLETGAVLAPVRNAIKLPGAALAGIRGLLGEWREDAAGLREDIKGGQKGAPRPSWSPKEIEQMRRTAMQQRIAFKRDPELRAKVRANAMIQGPSLVAGYRAGSVHATDVEAVIMSHEVSEILTPEEAATLRRDAGLASTDGTLS